MAELSIKGLATLLQNFAVEVPHEAERALDAAAKIIQDEAKAEIGTYQDAAGQFAAWQELAETTKKQRGALGYPENEPLLRTGDLRDSIQRHTEGMEAAVGSNSDIAVYQELGTSRIPPRSFLGGAATRKGEEAAKKAGNSVVMGLIGPGGKLPI